MLEILFFYKYALYSICCYLQTSSWRQRNNFDHDVINKFRSCYKSRLRYRFVSVFWCKYGPASTGRLNIARYHIHLLFSLKIIQYAT